MGKIVLMMSMSLDGYIEGPGHDISWHRVDDEVHRYVNDRVRELGAMLLGRTTHDLMADFWPTADADPAAPASVADFAAIWREKPKFVYSRTLEHVEGNTTIVRDVVPAEVNALKEQIGGDLGLGGAELAAAFLRQDLVDELRVYVHPVLVGDGTPLFPHIDRPATAALHLTESRTFGNGVVMLHYERPE
ncbi:dihydrofolate reductase family protein [Streptomyces sp. NPDC000618]|uniref:dihydrofolate reductase family protein n=1 Tax=Streptomyces sp. NPDC000618 TaxID=3154265 RepID=UPI0033290D25